MHQDTCSHRPERSSLVDTFARRVTGTYDAKAALIAVIKALFKTRGRARGGAPLESYLSTRNISELQYKDDIEYDGSIQPLGLSFADGFRIRLNRLLPATRLRFTLAHELCHTFFYEYVPEMKFVPHECDETEERLCNFGAGEILMPRSLVTRMAKGQPVCLRALEGFASRFDVSIEAMLVRLRTLGLWNADISYWTQDKRGNFISVPAGGVSSAQWIWRNNELLDTWSSGKSSTGRTFVEDANTGGPIRLKPICYEMQRRGTRIVVLHGVWPMGQDKPEMPLFPLADSAHKRKASGSSMGMC